GRPEVLDEVGAIAADDRGVLARDVAVLDREVRGFRSSPDDELIFVDAIFLVVENQVERRGGQPRARGRPGRGGGRGGGAGAGRAGGRSPARRGGAHRGGAGNPAEGPRPPPPASSSAAPTQPCRDVPRFQDLGWAAWAGPGPAEEVVAPAEVAARR